jgi:thiamine-phosphate pyrophosphorylase
MKLLPNCRLYTFVDEAYMHGRGPDVLAQELCAGGSDIIQLRAKTANTDDIRRMAEKIAPITSAAGIPLVINDYPAIAAEVGAQATHLGQEDFFDAGFIDRSQVPRLTDSTWLGLSSHAPEQAQRAIKARPNYIAIGPIYATGTKPGRAPVTLDYARWAAKHVPIPWFAIGGITLENMDAVLETGARRVCVVSAILNAKDVAKACHAFKERLSSAPLNSQ